MKIVWTLKELTEVLRSRQLNKFDVNIGVSGLRGSGKSTLLFKIFWAFKKLGFNQEKHQVYSRDDVMKLLSKQKFGYAWDDEAINSGYKREFQNKGQQKLIKMVTNYRDNFNVYGSALPFFYTLDKGLRELIFMHIHIVERGFAVILLPLANQIHGQDPWDTDNNKKIEQKENRRLEKNPNATFRYTKLTTFAGYLYFGDMTEKQRKKYEEIKQRKRAIEFKEHEEKEELTFIQKLFNAVIEKRLSNDTLLECCIMEDKKYSAVCGNLNKMLKNNGYKDTLRAYLHKDSPEAKQKEVRENLNELIPAV